MEPHSKTALRPSIVLWVALIASVFLAGFGAGALFSHSFLCDASLVPSTLQQQHLGAALHLAATRNMHPNHTTPHPPRILSNDGRPGRMLLEHRALGDAPAPPPRRETKVPPLQLPKGIDTLIINIGSNLQPLLPPDDEPSTAAIAVEPIVHCNISRHPRLFVLPIAIAAGNGLAKMEMHNVDSVSSSLVQPVNSVLSLMKEAGKDFVTPARFVPLLAMTDFLQSFPSEAKILFLKTDMQGMDYTALSSAGAALRRVDYLMTEVYFGGIQTYKGASNDFCRDMLPFMRSIGYQVIGLYTRHKYSDTLHKSDIAHATARDDKSADAFCRKGKNTPTSDKHGMWEGNAYWKRNDTTARPPEKLRP